MSENDTIPKKSTSQINKAVFFTSALLIFLLVAFAAVFPDVADKNFKLLQQQIFTNASWFYILAVALILLSVTFLGLSRYGDIKLGPDHAQPDFSYHSWFAMLFSAGMGIGLMFFGVAEPVMHYLSPELVSKTFNLYAYEPKSSNWLGGWTLLYWGWWLSWSPFVGMFIARVSRGRTIREFVTGVLFVPAGFTLMWMTVFGNSAIYLIMNQGATGLANTVQQDVALALFNFLEHFPFSSVLSFIAMAMVIVFFVTSADSGAMVVDTLASGGVANTPVWQRIFWASLMGIVAIALLLAGGLSALQTVTIASALPFSVILLISIYGLLKALRRDLTKRESLSMATIAPTAARNPIPWQRRLRNIAYLPKRSLVKRFMDDVIQPAMTLVQEELNKQGTISHISDAVDDRIRLEVDLGNELNFIYEVRLRGYISPTFALAAMDNDEQQTEQHRYYRAEVYLKEGGQNYDVMGWNQEQLINDILDQYEKHLHFLHLVR